MLRMLLILVSLLLSAPAAAMPACHDSPAAAHTVPMEHHRASDAQPPHACIGCVPVGDWLAERIAAPAVTPQPLPAALVRRLDLAGSAPPPLRPPRLG